MQAEAFVAQLAAEALGDAVPHRSTWRDEPERDAALASQ
jgi:hypothetical protein